MKAEPVLASNLHIIAPLLNSASVSEAEALGSVLWLWMHSGRHNELPLHTIPTLLLPAIKLNQYILILEGAKPIAFASWASMNAEAECRYAHSHQLQMHEADWNSGDRIWFVD